jgi:hypothetical protein
LAIEGLQVTVNTVILTGILKTENFGTVGTITGTIAVTVLGVAESVPAE